MKFSTCLPVLCIAACLGCQSFPSMTAMSWPSFDFSKMEFRSQNPKKDDDEFKTKAKSELIGKYTTISGLNMITLEGVGLVVGLNGTGGDPPPSVYRTQLLDDMRKRKVKNPNQVLRSPNTALVVVRAYLPPLIKKGDRFDIEVRLPGNSEATSLNGGWLLETYLSERAIVPGKGVMKGHVFAKASGPILISLGDGDKESLAGVLRRGQVLGGAVSLKERNLFLDLRSDFRGYRNVTRIEKRIGKRFFAYSKAGLRKSLATAKTDQRIELKLHPKYRDNYPRYLQVIRNIEFKETPIQRRVRLQKLKDELQEPVKAERAALQLEAVGQEAIPILKTGLRGRDPEVRFHSAVALAYLGETDGLKVLAESARDEPAFRIFALAAMATVEDAEANVLLRELMYEKSAEMRYGALRALTTLDKNDPFVRGEKLNDQFILRVLATSGPPMVHLTRHKKSEIAVFGADQRLKTPLALRAGRSILVTAQPRSDTITVTRFEVGEREKRKVISTRVADVIRTVAEFGASYPEVAGLLTQAHRQQILPGTVELDALPEAGRVYYRGRKTGSGGRKTRIGQSGRTPNIFMKKVDGRNRKAIDEKDDDEPQPKKKPAKTATAKAAKTAKANDAKGRASLTDRTDDDVEEADSGDEPTTKAKKKASRTLSASGTLASEPKPDRRWWDPLGWYASLNPWAD
jgi:flagellar basal body P-ring protein FlgI